MSEMPVCPSVTHNFQVQILARGMHIQDALCFFNFPGSQATQQQNCRTWFSLESKSTMRGTSAQCSWCRLQRLAKFICLSDVCPYETICNRNGMISLKPQCCLLLPVGIWETPQRLLLWSAWWKSHSKKQFLIWKMCCLCRLGGKRLGEMKRRKNTFTVMLPLLAESDLPYPATKTHHPQKTLSFL